MLKAVEVAQVCHEANKAYCERLGDFSQVDWFQAEEWQRDSEIVGVTHLVLNPEASPSASHTSWLAQKVREGWVYGPIKDAQAKTHPCCRPFEELPIEQQRKDFLFCAVVEALRPLIEPIEFAEEPVQAPAEAPPVS